ncbi:F0F1 ATP synthase subunit A [Mycoplasmatota bacterium]|nr:F0F1 ATP synthase subunit A [Mycoplasmatota bacterium]
MYHLKWVESDTFVIVPHVVSIIIIVIFLIILMLVINRKIKKADPLKKPKGLLLLVEIFVTTIDNFTVDMLGEKFKSFAPYLGYLAMYLFAANVFGLIGFTPPPTANLTVTLTFGLTTFFLIRYYGIKYNGWGHFKSLFKPIPLTPMNIIGELVVPISLSLRLFGNILSGTIVMALLYGGIGLVVNALSLKYLHMNFEYGELFAPFIGVPLLHVYFDLFAGFIQTFVFILLTSVFISTASEQ